MTRFPGLALALVVIALLLASGGQATPGQSTTLHGRVGPGFTISLTNESGARVTKLDPGTYDIEVQDLSDEHNFHLLGPGVDKATEIGSSGTVTWTVTLRDGTYTYQCDPHQGTMNGSFAVGNVPTPPPPPTPPAGGAVTPKTKLLLTSGPGFKITLKTATGKTVKSMKRGTYTGCRSRPVAHPQRARRRAGLQPTNLAAHLHGDADLEGQARANRHAPVPLRPACPRGHEGLGEDRPVMGARPESALADPGRANTPEGGRFAAAVVSTTQTERPARRQTGPCVTAFSVSDKP